jgi:hypothetical protein
MAYGKHCGSEAARPASGPGSGRRTLSVLLLGAFVVVAVLPAVLLVKHLQDHGRPSTVLTAGGGRSIKGESTPGGFGDEIGASEQWFYEQRAYPAAQTPRGALARAQRQARALKTAPKQGAPKAPVDWTELGPKPIGRLDRPSMATTSERRRSAVV